MTIDEMRQQWWTHHTYANTYEQMLDMERELYGFHRFFMRTYWRTVRGWIYHTYREGLFAGMTEGLTEEDVTEP